MADKTKTIKMPSTPRSAYDEKRPPNALILNQVRELEKAVMEAGRGVKSKKPKSEGQAAAYMRHLNRALHQQVLLPESMKRRPLDLPLDSRLAPDKPKSKSKSKSKQAKRKSKAPARKKKKTSRSKPKRSRRS